MHRFVSTWVGYIAALVITVIVMILYNHAQPALLYLVPANIGCRLMAERGAVSLALFVASFCPLI
jgi:hypothetical protein